MEAIARSRNFLHASLQLLTLGLALKNVHLLKKGILKSLWYTTRSTCAACTVLACYTSHLTHELHTDIHWHRRTTKGKMGGGNNQGLIFFSDKICPMSHLSMKGNGLHVKYCKDHLKISRNSSPFLHRPEPSHEVVAPCSWANNAELVSNYLCKIFQKVQNLRPQCITK